MAKVQFHQHALNAGELSPLLYGRVDVAKYQRGLKTATNVISLVHGGVKRRAGTRFVREVKNSANATRLIPFVYDRSTAYVLEFGDQYVRFYTSSGVVISGSTPYEIATPWTSAQLFVMTYTQNASQMLIAHAAVQPRQLVTRGATAWAVETLPAKSGIGNELNRIYFPLRQPLLAREYPQVTLSLTGTTGTVTATAATPTWTFGDGTREIVASNGARAAIVGWTSTTQLTLIVTDGTFPSTSIAAGSWWMEGALLYGVTPSASGTVNQRITLTAAGNVFKDNTFVDFYAGAPTLHVGSVGLCFIINGAAVLGDSYTSLTVITGVCLGDLGGSAADYSVYPATPAWTTALGYPAVTGLFDQRAIFCASPILPVTIWGSGINDFGDYCPGVADDDAFEFDLAADQAHQIMHVQQIRDMIVLTAGSTWSLSAADGTTITPTNVKAKLETPFGSSLVRPVRVGNELLYVQRGGLRVRSIGYQYDIDAYQSPDLTLLSEHITESGLVDMGYAQDPNYVVWCVRADGKLAALTIERTQDVTAWTRQETDGAFESVAVIPVGDADRPYFIVNRTINSTTERYVEYMDSTVHFDCAITGTAGSPTTVWSGLNHLEGETVGIIADGVYVGTKVVSSGAVTLNAAASAVEIGLPFTVTIATLTPEVAPGISGTQMMPSRANKIWLRVYQSTGDIVINGQTVTIATPPTLFSGDIDITNLGWSDGDGSITITQSQPYSLTILSIVQSYTVNQP